MEDRAPVINLSELDGFVFDMDGVVTSTARVHAAAWKRAFDEFLARWGESHGEEQRPFDARADYLRYVDGKPRYDGVRSFLDSRGISLPEGTPEDPPDTETVCGLGNRKNRYFLQRLRSHGADAIDSTVRFIRKIKAKGVRVAVISASRNAKAVLDGANVHHLFAVTVDGEEADSGGLQGKPAPDIFLEAARRLGTAPERTAVVEDALAGVEAGRAGGFGTVIGVDRGEQADALRERGADVVVEDLCELRIAEARCAGSEMIIPSALSAFDQVASLLRRGEAAVFLDYDGTLTPIVTDPSEATLPSRTRSILRRLADRWLVSVLSGRDLDDVRAMVDLDELVYAGSHGFDVSDQGAALPEDIDTEALLVALDRAESALAPIVEEVPGARIERKKFAIAVHFRESPDSVVPDLERDVSRIASEVDELKITPGKKIFELRPDVEWDKGKALGYLLEMFELNGRPVVPIYIGDDTTDEDAFREIEGRGIGIRVGDEYRATAARYQLRDPGEVAVFLEKLLDFAGRESSRSLWRLEYDGYDPGSERFRETLCATGNGYLVTRGAAPESPAGEHHYPGTYVGGCYNRRTSHVGGRDIENESLINVPNWLPLTFRIDDGPWFDLDGVDIESYRQTLDMAGGVLERDVVFSDAEGRSTRLRQRRFAHMGHRHLIGLETSIEPRDWEGTVTVRAALDGRVDNAQVERYQALDNHHLEPMEEGVDDDGVFWLEVETNQSRIRVAEAARVDVVRGSEAVEAERRTFRESGHVGCELTVAVGSEQPVTVDKIVAVCTSRERAISEPALQARAEIANAPGFGELLRQHVLGWQRLWDRCQMTCGVDRDEICTILNLHVFHLLQTVSPYSIDLDVGVPPRGLHGEAYRGLIMWDELFIFPLLNLRIPDLTRTLLQYRYRRLPRARWAAKQAGYRGAMFPWQSGSDGREEAQTVHLNPESGRWIPDNSQLQRHINIAVAYNVMKYYEATGDDDFMWFYGAEMLVDIASFWASIAEHDPRRDRYEIHNVMGPDEFHDAYPEAERPGIDNNAYTNVMVAWLLRATLDVLDALPPDRRRSIWESLELTEEDPRLWEEMSRKMYVPFHGEGIISQFEGYDGLLEFDWEGYRERYGDIQRLDRILEAEGDTPNRYKLSKQADVLMLFYLLSPDELRELFHRLGYPFDDDMMQRNVEYYLQRTAHGSTLSRVVHSWVVSRSRRKESWDLFCEALKSDVADIQGGTTHEGIHLGAMSGTVDLVQRCYTGMETRSDTLRFDPRLPDELEKIEFSIRYRNNWIDIHLRHDSLLLTSRRQDAGPVTVAVRGTACTLNPGGSLVFDLEEPCGEVAAAGG